MQRGPCNDDVPDLAAADRERRELNERHQAAATLWQKACGLYGGSGTTDGNEAGWLAILITNQAGVARGYFPEIMIDKVHRKLQEELGGKGARLDAIYYCPHVPNGDDPGYALDCQMRKPYPGMILKAAAEHGVDLEKSVMLGDKYSDLEAGWRAGCKSGLVLSGYGRGERELRGAQWPRRPDFVAQDAYHAVEIILNEVGNH